MITPPIDLSGKPFIHLDVYSSRTGSYIKFGILDAGGVNSEITPTLVANQWNAVEWDISGVTDVDKDAISQFTITIINADAANTIYVDNVYAYKYAGTSYINQAATKDTYIMQTPAYVTYNAGQQPYLELQCDTVGGGNLAENILLELDISDLPSYQEIIGVIVGLSYYSYSTADPAGQTITAYRLRDERSDWEEGTQTFGVDDACWINYKAGAAWGTAGAKSYATDRDPYKQSLGTFPAAYGWLYFDDAGSIQLVHDAMTNRAGILRLVIEAPSLSTYTAIRFRSTEYATASLRPYIEVVYTPGSLPSKIDGVAISTIQKLDGIAFPFVHKRNGIIVGIPATTPALFWGDSITVGVGASLTSRAWVTMVSAAKGWGPVNLALSGTESMDGADTIYASYLAPVSGYKSCISYGYNDMRHQGESETGYHQVADTIGACVVWRSMVAAAKEKVTAQNRDSETGTWGNTPAYPEIGRYTAVAGSTITFTVHGTVVYIVCTKQTASAGHFHVTIDGNPVDEISSAGFVTGNSGKAWGPILHRYGGLSDADHTVVLTAQEDSPTYVDFVAGNQPSSPCSVYVGNILHMNSAGAYALGGAAWDNGTDAAVVLYNSHLKAVIDQLTADGLDVHYADCDSLYAAVDPGVNGYSGTTDVALDNIHPNDSGHDSIYDAFLAVI